VAQRQWIAGRKLEWRDVVSVAFLAVLAMLSHGAIIFGLVPLAIVLVLNRTPFRMLVGGALVFTLFLAPLLMWHHFVDPPGDALIKFALAGTFGWETPGKTALMTVESAYSGISPGDWFKIRWNAIKTLFGAYQPDPLSWMWLAHVNTLGGLRLRDFLYLIPSF